MHADRYTMRDLNDRNTRPQQRLGLALGSRHLWTPRNFSIYFDFLAAYIFRRMLCCAEPGLAHLAQGSTFAGHGSSRAEMQSPLPELTLHCVLDEFHSGAQKLDNGRRPTEASPVRAVPAERVAAKEE